MTFGPPCTFWTEEVSEVHSTKGTKSMKHGLFEQLCATGQETSYFYGQEGSSAIVTAAHPSRFIPFHDFTVHLCVIQSIIILLRNPECPSLFLPFRL
jgi:hypothetical protein